MAKDKNEFFSYRRIFKKIINLNLPNHELMEKENVSKSTFYKMKNGKNVTTDVLVRICDVLDCDISEIVERIEVNEGRRESV